MELKDIKGLGPKRLKALQEAGISNASQLLWQLPSGYRDTTQLAQAAALKPGQMACLQLRILDRPRIQYVRGLSIVRALGEDESGQIRLIWFNQPWQANAYQAGQELLLYGRAQLYRGHLSMQNPQKVLQQGILPVYNPIGIVQGKVLAGYVAQLLAQIEAICPETLPQPFRQRHQLCDLAFALCQAHQPESAQALAMAKRRIGFENLLLYQLALRAVRGSGQQGRAVKADQDLPRRFWQQTGFEPTSAQRKVQDEILRDLASGVAMRRLVQGDVGSGKTAIAFLAAAVMAAQGYQTALMVPTEILARQHLESARRILAPLGIGSGLLLGSMKAAERREALEHIAQGDWPLVIGTQALFSQGVAYRDLGLVITDEQHRFGVRQRQRLSLKAEGDQPPHVLVMSATPIPRTLALILYGDLEVSVIDQMPPGRRPVKTRIVPEDKRAQMYRFIIDKAAQGEQSYLVCPLVEESEQIEAKDAQAMYDQLRQGPLKSLRLGLTYGSQPQADKEAVIAAFCERHVDCRRMPVVVSWVERPQRLLQLLPTHSPDRDHDGFSYALLSKRP